MYVSWRATRLDRLHVRLETARAGLDAALVRRAAVALELAASRQLDPATSLLLAAAAHEARIADADNREFAESDLSRALRAVVDQPDFRRTLAAREDGTALLEDLDAAIRKVSYARSFYNNAVTATRAARRKLPAPRLFLCPDGLRCRSSSRSTTRRPRPDRHPGDRCDRSGAP